jgi:hypothetical protein
VSKTAGLNRRGDERIQHEGGPMRFLILVKATADSEAGAVPQASLIAAMTSYHEQLAHAGVLLDAAGLQPTARGWRVHYEGGERHVHDGPFSESRDLVAGYTLIDVRSRDEALEWTRRFPAPHGERGSCHIEVRPLFGSDDFGPGAAPSQA